MSAERTLMVIAKQPVPGRVKTRLVPPLTNDEAAAVAAAALSDTLDAVDRAPATHRLLAFDGDPTGWRRPGWRVVAQPAGGLDDRLVAAFAAAPPGMPAVLVGMDTPQLSPSDLATVDLVANSACLGMATDGGYWAIGLADPSLAAVAINGVPMSTSATGVNQLDRLRALGLRVQLLDVRTDVDTIDTADEVAALAPHTRFAARLAAVRAAV